MLLQRITLLPLDPRKVRGRSSDPWVDRPRSACSKQWPCMQEETDEDPRCTCWWWGDYECQACSTPVHREEKAVCGIVLYVRHHGACLGKRTFGILRKNLQRRLKGLSDFVDMVSHHYAQQLPLIFTACHWQLRTATLDMQPDCSFPFQCMC